MYARRTNSKEQTFVIMSPVESCLHPLVDGQTSWVYPINPAQYLYIRCCVTVNKLVLSYLLLCLLPYAPGIYFSINQLFTYLFRLGLTVLPCLGMRGQDGRQGGTAGSPPRAHTFCPTFL
jgi:hypothetical protein